MSFLKLLNHSTTFQDGFTLTIPQDWHQGRTAYGGFSAALALHAAQIVGGDDLPVLRSSVVSFVGPLAGEISVRARVLRRGRNATWVAAEIVQGDAVGLTATFVFMSAVASQLALDTIPLPAGLIAPDACRPAMSAMAPAFMKAYYEARFALPRGDVKKPEVCWWVRLKEADDLDPMAAMLLIADALPPGAMPMMDARVPVSSMTWQCNLLTAAPVTQDGWWLLRSVADYARDGCSSQQMHIWNADGVPVMSGMQAVALFG
jgi:acyl-CoA thioesterase